jgi:uncharacterized cupin superfamily protein
LTVLAYDINQNYAILQAGNSNILRKHMNIFNINALSHHELVSAVTGEKYSHSAVLTEYFNFQDIFVHHEILPPGRKTSASHRHTSREEMVIVLEGSPIFQVGNQVSQLKTGDIIGFSPASLEVNFIENKTNEIVKLLVICSNPPTDNIIYN